MWKKYMEHKNVPKFSWMRKFPRMGNLKYKVNGKHILLPIYRTFVGHFVRRRNWRYMLYDR